MKRKKRIKEHEKCERITSVAKRPKPNQNDEKSLSVFKMTYNKAKDGHVKHSQRINKITCE